MTTPITGESWLPEIFRPRQSQGIKLFGELVLTSSHLPGFGICGFQLY